MLSRHRVSRAAIELIKRFEGYRRHAAQLPDGRWTIGYGHTLTAREGAEVSESDAEALLLYDLISVAHVVSENVYSPLSQNQFDALTSFAFNVGSDNFRRSQVLKRLNAGAFVQAACAMELWRKADFEGERIVVDALVRRRAAEKALFLTPQDEKWTPAPSPILRPMIDLDALDLVPLRRPVRVEASMEGPRVELRRDYAADPDDFAPPSITPAPEPAPAVTAAAEAVTARLESIFAEPGPEPELEPEASPETTPIEDVLFEPVAEAALEPEPVPDEARPQADFAPPITTAGEGEPELETEPEPLPQAAFQPAADAELDIPQAPGFRDVETPAAVGVEDAPFDHLIPARSRPAPLKTELSVVWDLVLALLGIAFFGFALFWGLNATPGLAPVWGFITPQLVAWLAGLAGVGLDAVAVYRMLQRLGRAAERD
jgi:lysozyme